MEALIPPAPSNFAARLRAASEILEAPEDQIISVKIRPIENIGRFETVYRSSDLDYLGFYDNFGGFDEKQLPQFNVEGSKARVYDFGNKIKCLVVEHESGPEFLLNLHQILQIVAEGTTLLSTSAIAAEKLLKLINHFRPKVQKPPSLAADQRGRFVATSIETRTKRAQQLVRQLDSTAKATDKAIESWLELKDDF